MSLFAYRSRLNWRLLYASEYLPGCFVSFFPPKDNQNTYRNNTARSDKNQNDRMLGGPLNRKGDRIPLRLEHQVGPVNFRILLCPSLGGLDPHGAIRGAIRKFVLDLESGDRLYWVSDRYSVDCPGMGGSVGIRPGFLIG